MQIVVVIGGHTHKIRPDTGKKEETLNTND